MTTSPSRPPWETSRWRTFHEPPPEPPAGKAIGTLGVIAIAVGVGVLGYYMLDGHTHTCEACGYRWRHLGAFNFGDPGAHTCRQCGTVQWWKDGYPNVFRGPLQSSPMDDTPDPMIARLQEIRGFLRQGLPSGASAACPRGVLR